MKTANLPKIVRDEFQKFDYESLARQIMRGNGPQYSIIIDYDGSMYWDYNVYRKERNGRILAIMECPYYPEPVTSPGELRSLTRELRRMVYDKIMSIPDTYWV